MSFDNNVPTKFPALAPKAPSGDLLLAHERAKAQFNVDELSKFMYTEEWLNKMHKVLKVLETEPAFDKTNRYYESRQQRVGSAYMKDKRLIELIREHNWDETEVQIASFLYDMSSPFTLHYGMFIPTLKSQTTDEQKKLFLEPALKHQIIGCYAQTELGHGSNVQGLETTATYIPETNEFELHSPTLTSAKWWIGGLGTAATHAIVMARLISNGKDLGPHPFCVQIRSLEDHRPMKGVTVGDIGPKFGFNSVDNGFVMFDHYRIPHVAFLSKYAQVKPGSGEYIKPPNAKLSYGTMVFVRANIVMGVRYAIAKATTIAVRYSAVRQQFVDAASPRKWNNKVIETPVLDYTMQQYRLLPTIAAAYACFFTGSEMLRLYNLNQEAMQQGNFSLLADLHASSSGLKSLTTTMAVEAIEDCRRACGGHGYSMFSGLGMFYQDYLPNVTWEGDNYILTQQTARYLLKTFRNVVAGKAVPSEYNQTVTYLSQYMQNPKAKCPATSPKDFLNPELVLSAFGFRAAYGIAQVAEQIDRHGRSWNSMLVEISRISKAHCQFMLIRNFIVSLQDNAKLSKDTVKVLRTLSALFALHTMEKELADFVLSGYLNSEQATMLKTQVIDLLEQVRPQAVALVDAFALPDYYLHSALGRYDGKVYESMTSMAEREPLNQTMVVAEYEKIIKPLVHQGKNQGRWSADGTLQHAKL
ncbi:acyl-CoA dehydrogenase/oxidase C-terminal [Radiomyces spectabilis]|uniref:acyl-CoA dehydrogenase/oxidase C-terminal n=1 Tax=Radiomyces spectabilis TaxID=64574 RepID=UPI0022211E20|nr:acyl-CoA dehydrogenase/oxidase C-terminal [Radiomyces spectabilis]KAI8391735.1 acyl-CoA dehydrogenase/oxidase C-terminal [Radiomyces spectabilis]